MDAFMDAFDHYSSDDSLSDGELDSPRLTLHSIQKRKLIKLPLRASYSKSWMPREAFRELVQNWRDAIIKSFNLSEDEFHVARDETVRGRTTDIIFKAFQRSTLDSPSPECLGYVWFKGTNGQGVVEISNRKALLEPDHLELGGTTKDGDDQQAGAHGEGMKLALLVLQRKPQNHHVQCVSGGFTWKFNFSKETKTLVANLSRMTPEALLKAQSRKLLNRPYRPSPIHDVTFTIGRTVPGVDEAGAKTRRAAVTRKEFEEWVKCALFLHESPAGAFISTKHGDLLTDDQLLGNIYLKGLLLSESTNQRSASSTTKTLGFGYNFVRGKTNRERESLASTQEESRSIMDIWFEVLKSKPDMIVELHRMLIDETTRYADTEGAAVYMQQDTVCLLRKYLTTEPYAKRWYYPPQAKLQNNRLDAIIQGLGREPFRLPKQYWDVFHGPQRLRSAEDEERRRFLAAPGAPRVCSFSASISGMLRACMRACEQTKDAEVKFVQAGSLQLRLFRESAKTLRLHERLLTREGAIADQGLPDGLSDRDIIYHVVAHLFNDAISQVPLGTFQDDGDNGKPSEWHRQSEVKHAHQRLLDYQRTGPLRAFPGKHLHSLRVEWYRDDEWRHPDQIQIHCHRASQCSHIRDSCLVSEDMGEDEGRSQGCRRFLTSYCASKLTISELDPTEEYFFVLSVPSSPGFILLMSDDMKPSQTAAPLARAAAESFTQGQQLPNREGVWDIPMDGWYEAVLDNKVRGIIGLAQDDDNAPKPGRKRCRR